MKQFKVVVEHHEDGYVAYPIGLNGIVVGQGNTATEAIDDVRSAIQFHLETFGVEALGEPVEDVTLADVIVAA
jgi:predicted RNase H-like HicB family nuclease